jgi:chemotaxis protein histidine kinase CheA
MDIFQEEIDLNDIVEILEKTDLLIIEYEDSLLQNNEKSELIHIIFRHIHNLKGLLFSTDKKLSSQLIHIIESNFDLIRKNVIQASKEILEKSLNGLDLIKKNILNDTEFVEESEFLIKILEETYESQKKLQNDLFIVKAPLDQKEFEKLKYAEENNLNIFQVEKLLNSDITKEEFETLFIYQDIKEIGNLICSFPKFENINKNEPQIVLKIIFATYMDDSELEMHIFDAFKKVKVELGEEDLTTIEPIIFEEEFKQPSDEKLKCLVLENDFFNRRILQKTLSEIETCDIAISLEEAFEAYKYEYEANYKYDYIFIDSNFDENLKLLELIKNHQKEN